MIVEATVWRSLQRNPAFGAAYVEWLRAAGLDDNEVSHVVHGASFFNWANLANASRGELLPEVRPE